MQAIGIRIVLIAPHFAKCFWLYSELDPEYREKAYGISKDFCKASAELLIYKESPTHISIATISGWLLMAS